jgi:ankyrin repeat protein
VSDGCGDMAMNLHEAVESGDVVEVRRLVAAGADVEEQRGEHGLRPLHWTADHGHVEVLRVLVELGANKEAKTVTGLTPLHVAALRGRVEAMKVLVQLGVDKEAKDCCWMDAPTRSGNQRARGGHQGVGGDGREQGGEG